jgi:hypothetical protein
MVIGVLIHEANKCFLLFFLRLFRGFCFLVLKQEKKKEAVMTTGWAEWKENK